MSASLSPQKGTSGTPRVLIVDDDPNSIELLQMCLERAGCSADAAISSAEALALWQHRGAETDLLIVDFNLGDDLTGLQLAEQLCAEKPDLKTIVLSGHEIDERFRGRTEGIDFLKKPFKLSALVSAVLTQLSLVQS